MIVRRFDEESGVLHVVGTGIWSVADVDAHYAELRHMIAEVRAADRPVRVLSDVRRATRQTPEVETHIRRQMAETFRPGDRVVVLTMTDSDKMHVRGILGLFEIKAFSSPIAAEIWLFADEAGDLPAVSKPGRPGLLDRLRITWMSLRR